MKIELNGDTIRKLAIDLTKIKSIVGTKGECAIAEKVYSCFKAMPYFKKNSDKLMYVSIEGDRLGRKSVLAYIKGNGNSNKTVVLIGHIDTVGIDDFGDIKGFATNPELLVEKLNTLKLDEESKRDLDSGDYLFARGIFDMKTGVASLMVLMQEVSKDPRALDGNLVFLGVPDEEGNSAGMLSAVKVLSRLKQKEGFQYIAAVDTDYMAPRFAGDEHKYIYIGTVGKLLPCFYIVGKETHVGQAFEGLDPNMIASEIMLQVDLSEDLCDIADGEATIPPISLRLQDLKNEYSVQTAHTANLYFNFATHSSQPDEVLEKMVAKAEFAFSRVIEKLNVSYMAFCEKSGIPYKALPWKPKVMTYEQLYYEVKRDLGEELDEQLRKLKLQLKKEVADDRVFSLRLVEEVFKNYRDKAPVIVFYFSPPYYPHIFVKNENEKDRWLLDAVESAVESEGRESGYDIKTRKFYPYISDLSYCGITDDMNRIAKLTANMPAWPDKYSLPVEAIQDFNVPVVNIGPFGKDAHKFTERVNVDYSFRVMPKILAKTIENLFADKSCELALSAAGEEGGEKLETY
jgi:arginine utilization protein RocB